MDLNQIVTVLKAAPAYSLDIETTSLQPLDAQIIGVSMSTGDGPNTWWFPFNEKLTAAVFAATFKEVFEDPNKTCILHNAKYDLSCLSLSGIAVKNRIADTMVAVWILDPSKAGSNKLGLKVAVKEFLGHQMVKYQETALTGDLFGKDTEEYAKDDALQTFRLWLKLEQLMKERDPDGRFYKAFWDLEMPMVPIAAEMELSGIAVNRDYLKKLDKTIVADLLNIQEAVRKMAGHPVLLSSPDQVRSLLLDELKMVPPDNAKTGKSGKLSMDYESLQTYKGKHPVIDQILKHREQTKLLTTYVRPLLEFSDRYGDHRVHVEFWTTGTDIGRWTSKGGINLQNQPREGGIRQAFIAPKGKTLVCADYGQLELRMAAHVTGDPALVTAYSEGADVHKQTSEACGCARQVAKTLNFGSLYGASPKKIANVLWLDAGLRVSEDEARVWMDKFWEKYRGLQAFHNRVRSEVKSGLMNFKTITGRIKNVKDVKPKGNDAGWTKWQKERQEIEAKFRVAAHFQISGSSADVMMISMRNIHRTIQEKALADKRWADVKFLVQVHDEIVLEAPDEIAEEIAALVKNKMETCVKLRVPLVSDCHMGKDWLTAKGK
jgi:DNA polymerase-1